jgi:hypothetical protein
MGNSIGRTGEVALEIIDVLVEFVELIVRSGEDDELLIDACQELRERADESWRSASPNPSSMRENVGSAA